MAFRQSGRSIAAWLFTALTVLAPAAAYADVCVSVDAARDTFSPQDRNAALLLLARQFELAGERVVPADCATPYIVSHVQLGNTIVITLSGPNGQRDATALGMNDVPAVYSQMVRSLLRGLPMQAPGVVDRTNVSSAQSAAPNRVYSDSLLYARLGYGGIFGDRTYSGPAIGMIGYRRELDAFGIDVSFFNLTLKASDRSYTYATSTGSSGTTGSWLTLQFLRFLKPRDDRSPYVGAGLSWSTASLDNGSTSWSGNGLQGELTAGYELGRASTIRVFVQAGASLPFYKLTSQTYVYLPTYPSLPATTTEHRYAPSLNLSLGLGWQRGGR